MTSRNYEHDSLVAKLRIQRNIILGKAKLCEAEADYMERFNHELEFSLKMRESIVLNDMVKLFDFILKGEE